MNSKRRVVITGLGMATSLGLDVEENWQKALSGISGIRKLSLPNTGKSPVQAVGSITEADWTTIQDEFRDEASKEGERRTLFALWAAQSALKDAGLFSTESRVKSQELKAKQYSSSKLITHNSKLLTDRCGVVMAAGLGINRLEDIQRWLNKNKEFDIAEFGREYKDVHKESLIKNNSSRPAALIAKRFGLNGYNATITTACASASQAIGTAYRAVSRGDANMIVAGGADSMINPVGLVFFVLLSAAAVSAENPSEVCRPFDRKRSGLVMGEGAGIIILEEESHAVKRGAKIYAEVAGYGSTMDAYKVTAPDPQGTGAEHSMMNALKDADMGIEQIDYINAHGTSTKLNDAAETLAIKKVFKEHAQNISINSSKSIIGHLLAASGGPEFVFTALSVSRDKLHPTINLKNRDPKCDLDYVPDVAKEKTVNAAISNSFGFGGQNASIVVKKYK
ncbi:MAG: beta-ketoacyl-[acyl-carrier-protein] synthase family protein [Nitrospirae bacterium]|nr:beta-ketoacyl-[acyl-carrier-protein] synthase family protein [Nitrospirota bacterium]